MFSHMSKAKCICVGFRDPLARARNNLKGMIYASHSQCEFYYDASRLPVGIDILYTIP